MNTLGISVVSLTVFLCVLAMCVAWFLDREQQRRHDWHKEYLGLPYPGDEVDDEPETAQLSTSGDPKDPQQS